MNWHLIDLVMITILRHFTSTTANSIRGLKTAFIFDYSYRLEHYLTVIVVPLALVVGSSQIEYIFLIFSWFLILITELINTAIETIIDYISLERHELAGRAKDLGSAAVFMACLNALLTWLIILLNH